MPTIGTHVSADERRAEAPRPVLSRDDAIVLGHRLLTQVQDRSASIRIEHVATSLTTLVNGTVRTEDRDHIQLQFNSEFGSGMPINIETNRLRDASFHRVTDLVAAMAPPRSPADVPEPDDADDAAHFTYNPRTFVDVSLWHDTTVGAMAGARGDLIPSTLSKITAANLVGATTVGISARSVLYLYKQGLTAFSEETDCEFTVTARTPDGRASGWGGVGHRDWTQLNRDNAITRAVELALRSRDRIALEPGRRMVILSPTAAAQLVSQIPYAFHGGATIQQAPLGTPFTLINHEAQGSHTKLGMRVFDPRLRIVSDPTDQLGGYAPFYELDGIDPVTPGFPTQAVTWVDRGILQRLAFPARDSLSRRLTPSDLPRSFRLTVVPGTKTATIDEMIENCIEGVYVNRFSDITMLDRRTGMVTGVTRDGCFLVKNGMLTKPVKNFRFIDSPFLALNRVELIGKEERAAFGYSRGDNSTRWPHEPVIVPPMMIHDFNFTKLSDAV